MKKMGMETWPASRLRCLPRGGTLRSSKGVVDRPLDLWALWSRAQEAVAMSSVRDARAAAGRGWRRRPVTSLRTPGRRGRRSVRGARRAR
jgi:hypothetical protein